MSFPDKQKLKEFMTTKPAIQEILRGTLSGGKKKDQSGKHYKGQEDITRNTKSTGNTMVLNSYLSIITLNVNGLNAQIKRHRVEEWMKKNKIYLYDAYKRLILDLRTPAD